MYVKRKGKQEESVQQEQWGLNLESKVAFRVLIITCNAVLGPTSQSLLFPLYFCPAINCSPSPSSFLFSLISFVHPFIRRKQYVTLGWSFHKSLRKCDMTYLMCNTEQKNNFRYKITRTMWRWCKRTVCVQCVHFSSFLLSSVAFINKLKTDSNHNIIIQMPNYFSFSLLLQWVYWAHFQCYGPRHSICILIKRDGLHFGIVPIAVFCGFKWARPRPFWTQNWPISSGDTFLIVSSSLGI